MRDIVAIRDTGEAELTVSVPDPSVPFVELLRALDLGDRLCTVDGRLVPASASILDARLRTGSVIAPWQKADGDETPGPAVAVLEQIGGLKAGGSMVLGTGEFVVGPSSESGLTEGVPDEVTFRLVIESSRRVRIAPAEATVAIGERPLTAQEDLRSSVIAVGGSLFDVRVPGQSEVGADDPFVEAPTPSRQLPVETRSRSGRAWKFIAAAAVLFLIAVIAAPANVVVPVTATLAVIAGLWWLTWLTDRRHRRAATPPRPAGKPTSRSEPSRSSPRNDPAAELRNEYPSIAEVVMRAESAVEPMGSTPIRSNRDVVIAYGHIDGSPDRLVWAPIVAHLERGPLAILGPRRAALAVARSVVLFVAAGSSPDRLPITLGHEPTAEGEWEWLKWLPHVRTPAAEGASPFVIFDDQDRDGDPNAAGRQLLANHTTGVIIAHPGGSIPSFCRQVLTVDGDGTCTFSGAETHTGLCAVGIDRSTALDAVRGMCRTIDHLSVADIVIGRRPERRGESISVDSYNLSTLLGLGTS